VSSSCSVEHFRRIRRWRRTVIMLGSEWAKAVAVIHRAYRERHPNFPVAFNGVFTIRSPAPMMASIRIAACPVADGRNRFAVNPALVLASSRPAPDSPEQQIVNRSINALASTLPDLFGAATSCVPKGARSTPKRSFSLSLQDLSRMPARRYSQGRC